MAFHILFILFYHIHELIVKVLFLVLFLTATVYFNKIFYYNVISLYIYAVFSIHRL